MKTPQLLQITHLGQPILRKKAKEIIDITDLYVQQLIDDMIATVKEVDGVGIAAPQVYQSLRIFIVASEPNARYPHAPYMKPLAVINPKILSVSDEKEKEWEGCLSIPGIRGFVPRHTKIRLTYLTREGKKEEKEFNGFVARIFQHEYDHIEGKVFLDRLETVRDIISDKEYLRMVRKMKKRKTRKKSTKRNS